MNEAERTTIGGALLVQVMQPSTDRSDDRQRTCQREGPSVLGAQQLQQVAAVHVLHRQEVLAVVLAEVEHLRQVGMRQPGRQARLVEEHPRECGVLRQVREDSLERDDLREPRRTALLGDVQLRHPADRQSAQQDVPVEHRARSQTGSSCGVVHPLHDSDRSVASQAPPRPRCDDSPASQQGVTR